MKLWLLIALTLFVFSCDEDNDPVKAEPGPTLEEQVLGEWKFVKGELFDGSSTTPNYANYRSENCQDGQFENWSLVRQIDLRITTDDTVDLKVVILICFETSVWEPEFVVESWSQEMSQ